MASVLVVDDDTDVLDILAVAIRSGGHSVIKATSGTAALNVLDGDIPFDLLVTDIIMPGLNGFNLARMANMRRPGLKIMYLTGFHEQAEAMRDHGSRLGKLLNKPIMPADLRKEVDEALATTLS
jgi:two-component system cell cycle response regulator CpdR